MTGPPRPRVLWLTHLAAPYRVPVWRALGSRWAVQIQTEETERGIGRPGSENRGDDWRPSRFPDLDVVGLRTLRLRVRGRPLWVPLPTPGALRMRDAAVAVLGGGWESPSFWWLVLRAKALRRPVVCFYESPGSTHRFSRGVVPLVRRFVFARFDAVVVPGVAARDSVLAMGVPGRRIHQGFNPVDVRGLAAQAAAVRAEHAEAPAGHRFVFVGQLIPRKRVLELLDAFGAAAGPDDRLTVIGVGALESAIRRRADAAGLGARVDVVGYVENDRLMQHLARQHTLCLVSDEEVWGLVVNEALAAGLQVVVSDNCGVAPSVAGMAGVHLVDSDLTGLPGVLRDAVRSWHGPIEDPEILRYGPEEFADVLDAAFRAVLAPSSGGGPRPTAE